MAAIRVEKLSKSFNGFRAVRGISFEVGEGELFGLLGPNGAGKTTTINMLSTLIKPSSGRGFVAGYDIVKQTAKVRESIGIVFQEPALENKLTGEENLYFHALIYGLGASEARKRVSQVLRLVGLSERARVLVEKYSGGMKRRLEIARGLIHKPKVLFLDEPTLGLDAQTRRSIWEYIKKLKGVSIILTTHYMEEADHLCERLAIMDNGRIVALDTPENLKGSLGGDLLALELKGGCNALLDYLKKEEWLKGVRCDGNQLFLTLSRGELRIPEIVSIAEGLGIQILSANLRKPSLEDVFIKLTGKKIRDNGPSKRVMRLNP